MQATRLVLCAHILIWQRACDSMICCVMRHHASRGVAVFHLKTFAAIHVPDNIVALADLSVIYFPVCSGHCRLILCSVTDLIARGDPWASPASRGVE